jgi:septal ring factor EnvC (AmiA/AmiB activator)
MKLARTTLARTAILASAVSLMGIAMPSCPGQEAMQKQIDSLTQSNAELTRKVQMMDASLKTNASDMGQAKQLFEQMTNALQSQKTELTNVETALKDAQAQLAELVAAQKKGAKRTRKH